MRLLFFFSFLFYSKDFTHSDDVHWKYSKMQDWGKLCNSGKEQSPIAIDSSTAKNYSLGSIIFNPSYSNVITLNITNNGHTVLVKPSENKNDLEISGGSLGGTFKLEQFHMHWGLSSSSGSEHTIDGKNYSMEIHFVHKLKDTNEEKKRNLAVLGVMVEVGDQNDKFQPLISEIKNLEQPNQKILQVKIPSLLELFPQSKSYFRYDGGLTTPPCSEIVTWTVFKKPIKLSEDQLKVFRKVSWTDTEKYEYMVNNWRPTMKKNERTVLFFSSSSNQISYSLIALILLVAFLFEKSF